MSGTLKVPTVSHIRGFYDAPFDLVLLTQSGGSSVRYTLDGTIPSFANGIDYTGPLQISGTTILKAITVGQGLNPSRSITHTYIFLADVMLQSPDGRPPNGWPESWGANTVDYGMDPEVVNDPAYRKTIKDDLKTLPSFSIVMNLADLFDPTTGIYANAMRDGRASERACSLELMFPDGAEGFQIDAGIRIRGGFSRIASNPKHAFRFFFRSEYGEAKLRFPLFGDDGADTFDNIDLRTFQNYSWSFLGDRKGVFVRDQSARDSQLAMGKPAKRGDFCHLFINGVYWGLYNTDERAEASYAESYFGGSKENYDVIKVEPFIYRIEATDGNLDAWIRLYEFAKSGIESESAYERIQGNNPNGTPNAAYENLLDIDNLIDYMLLIFYGGNLDAPVSSFLHNNRPNNFYAIRERNGPEGFRFLAHDSEHTLLDKFADRTGPYIAGETSVAQSNPHWLFQKLTANAEFRLRFADHVHRHFFNDGALTARAAVARFETRIHEIDRAVVGESARWGDSKRAEPFTRDREWLATVNEIRAEFFPLRTQIVLVQLQSKNLYPGVQAPSFSQHGGLIAPGFQLNITAPAGTIHYTIDGSDPRLPGGEISPVSRHTQSSLAIPETTQVKARVEHNGVWSALNEARFEVPQDLSGLRISEIMYHPPDEHGVNGNEFEFIELKNRGPTDLDLGGVHFMTGIGYVFPNGLRILAGEVIVLASNPTWFKEEYPTIRVDGFYSGQLSNAGEEVTLVDSAGSVIDSVTYSDRSPWPEEADGNGYSLELADIGIRTESADPSAWRPSEHIGGSPGIGASPANETPTGPIAINEILYRTEVGEIEFIELKNLTSAPVNLFDQSSPDHAWKLEGVDFEFTPGQGIPAFGLALVAASEPSAFRARYRIPEHVPVFGPYEGVLEDTGERLRLVQLRPGAIEYDSNVQSMEAHLIADAVRYRSIPPWPSMEYGNAGSIERIHPLANGNDPANWRKSPGYPSPGFENNRNRNPVVNGGSDLEIQTNLFPIRVRLDGQTQDDGLPRRPNRLLALWTIASGPGGVSFEPGNAASTGFQISNPGSYLLRLVAFDGLRFGHDEVVVTVMGRDSFGISDLDNDGRSDLLFQHRDGSLAVWFMDGVNLTASALLSPEGPGNGDWRVAGIGDFDRDGQGDLLFQHTAGALSAWIMDGTNLRLTGTISPSSPDDPNWRVVALADFNADGHSDFLFQHSNGALVIWMMDGVIFQSNQFPVPNHPGDKAWRVAAVRDFNRDGKPDILMQHTDGTLAVWVMNGLTLDSVSFLEPSRPENESWRVVSVNDVDGDEDLDLILQDSRDGSLAVWLLNQLRLDRAESLNPSQPGDGWSVVGP